MKEKHCLRLADNVRAADHHALLAGNVNAALFEKHHNACRRTRQEIVVADHYFADVHFMECIHILLGINVLYYNVVVKMLRQRKLNEYAVNVLVRVKLVNEREKLFFARRLGKLVDLRMEADLLTAFFLVFNVNLRGRILAHDYNRKSGSRALRLQRRTLRGYLGANLCRYFLSVDYICHSFTPYLYMGIRSLS